VSRLSVTPRPSTRLSTYSVEHRLRGVRSWRCHHRDLRVEQDPQGIQGRSRGRRLEEGVAIR